MGKKRVPREVISQIRTAMVMQFPNCFAAKGQPKKPLKIRIDRDIFQHGRAAYPDLSRKLISAFLRDYTGGLNYHRCMIEGAIRVDLNGEPAGKVALVDAAYHANMEFAIEARPRRSPNANKIERLKARLEVLRAAEASDLIGNDSYFTSLTKKRRDAEMSEVEREIKALEAA